MQYCIRKQIANHLFSEYNKHKIWLNFQKINEGNFKERIEYQKRLSNKRIINCVYFQTARFHLSKLIFLKRFLIV